MSQNFVVPESRKVLLKNPKKERKKKTSKPTVIWRHAKEIQKPTERAPMAKAGTI